MDADIPLARWPAENQRIDAALSEGGVLDPLSGADEQAVRHWLDDVGEDAATPRLEEVVLHSDDPDDLTLRTARLLGQADAVFHALAGFLCQIDEKQAKQGGDFGCGAFPVVR